MKSYTAKEFSRCPAKVYEAARTDGGVEITHDRFGGVFTLKYEQTDKEYLDAAKLGNKLFSPTTKHKKGEYFISKGFVCRVESYRGGNDFGITEKNKIGDIAHVKGYRVTLIEKAPS